MATTFKLKWVGPPGSSVIGYPPVNLPIVAKDSEPTWVITDEAEAVTLVKSGAYAPDGWKVGEAHPLDSGELIAPSAWEHFPEPKTKDGKAAFAELTAAEAQAKADTRAEARAVARAVARADDVPADAFADARDRGQGG